MSLVKMNANSFILFYDWLTDEFANREYTPRKIKHPEKRTAQFWNLPNVANSGYVSIDLFEANSAEGRAYFFGVLRRVLKSSKNEVSLRAVPLIKACEYLGLALTRDDLLFDVTGRANRLIERIHTKYPPVARNSSAAERAKKARTVNVTDERYQSLDNSYFTTKYKQGKKSDYGILHLEATSYNRIKGTAKIFFQNPNDDNYREAFDTLAIDGVFLQADGDLLVLSYLNTDVQRKFAGAIVVTYNTLGDLSGKYAAHGKIPKDRREFGHVTFEASTESAAMAFLKEIGEKIKSGEPLPKVK